MSESMPSRSAPPRPNLAALSRGATLHARRSPRSCARCWTTPLTRSRENLRLDRKLRAGGLAQSVDRLERPFRLVMPEGPAVAGDRPLHLRADFVDRALRPGAGDRAVGPHFRLVPRRRVVERGPRRDQPKLDQCAERDALLGPLSFRHLKRGWVAGFERTKPRPRRLGVSLVAFDADERSPQPLGHDRSGARAEKRIEHDIARMARRKNDAVE